MIDLETEARRIAGEIHSSAVHSGDGSIFNEEIASRIIKSVLTDYEERIKNLQILNGQLNLSIVQTVEEMREACRKDVVDARVAGLREAAELIREYPDAAWAWAAQHIDRRADEVKNEPR